MPRLVLMWLVRFRVVDAIAARNGVQVTPAETQQALVQAAAQIEQQTGSAITPAQFAVFNALPPEPDRLRMGAMRRPSRSLPCITPARRTRPR